MNLNSFDYYTDAPEPTIGFTRTASLIRTARHEAAGDLVLLFDNGDSLQGTLIGDWAMDPAKAPHILMQAFGDLGYDAIGLGNHDFGFGLDVLDRVVAGAPCPVICSNAHRTDLASGWQNHVILERTAQVQGQNIPLKIGVFSVLPPQTAKWEAHHLKDKIVLDDILTCAREKVQALQTHGCDLILALAHTGLGSADATPGLENAIVPLAAIDGIDALIAGHSHLTLPGAAHDGIEHVDSARGLVHGKPVVMPGSAGSYLGLIDLTLGATDAGGWSVQDRRAELRPVCPTHSKGSPDPIAEDPRLLGIFANAHAETRKRAAEPVGRTDRHLHSFFSFCAQDRGLALVAAAQAAGLRPYLVDTQFRDLPVLSAVSPSKFGGRAGPRFFTNIPPGEICLRHVNDLYVFPNELQAVVVTAEQIRDWLDMSVGVFNQLSPDHQTALVDPNRAGHNFDILQGLTYQIDLSQPPRFGADGGLIDPARRRVRDTRYNDRPLTDDQRFVVALNNYRASGGGHFPFVDHAIQIDLPVLPIQRLLRDYLSGHSPADPLEKTLHPFRFAPLNRCRTTLRTGQAARQHLAEIADFDPHIVGSDDEGFLLIRLTL